MAFYVDVILPVPVENLFTYELSEEQATLVQPGMRIAVSFGVSKIYTAIAYKIHENPPLLYKAKPIYAILDKTPTINTRQLQFWLWMATYYLCSLNEVCRAAVPSALLLGSETLVTINEKCSPDIDLWEIDEISLYNRLKRTSTLSVTEISLETGKRHILPLLERMTQKNAILIYEGLREVYKPKLTKHVRLHPRYNSDEELHTLIDKLNAYPKQRELVYSLLLLESAKKPVKVTELNRKVSSSVAVYRRLLKKEILQEYTLETDRVQVPDIETEEIKSLSEPQQAALEQVQSQFTSYQTVLLHGVTASGKTELYVKLMAEALKEHPHRQILYLLPEIALTQQLIQRLRRYFGDCISPYHSNYSLNERVEVWKHCEARSPKTSIIVGTRSALFLPFSDIELIIVDEEHEPSFKQSEPAPRYHARDSALVLAKFHQARVLLGSATPALETYYNAQNGKYGLVTLTERYGDAQLPSISLVNLREKYFKRLMKGHFSDTLVTAIKTALQAGEQVILFQNRRGYAPALTCRVCGHAPQCTNCDVTLTYHKHASQLRCHYCGYHIALPQTCPVCGSADIDTKGFGTEQVEVELKQLFPDASIGRMDWDTTRGKRGYELLLAAFDRQEIQILVGTQMLTKGLDFGKVSLVGIMNADSLFHFPEFRSHERAFQRILQVAGRAGRRNYKGTVLIQTYHPNHPILQYVLSHDYEGMYKSQCAERLHYHYPPFYKLIKITVQDASLNKVNEGAEWLAASLRNSLTDTVLGPEFPMIARVRNKHHKNILIKVEKQTSLNRVRHIIQSIGRGFHAIRPFRNIRLFYNIDPD